LKQLDKPADQEDTGMAWGGNGKASGDRAAFWGGHIAGQRDSGMSIRAYCRREGLNEGAFYQWRRRLSRRTGDTPDTAPGAAFAEVRLAGQGDSARDGADSMEVVLGNGRVVRVPLHFDASAVVRLVTALEEGAPC
jgi:transposase-like protein